MSEECIRSIQKSVFSSNLESARPSSRVTTLNTLLRHGVSSIFLPSRGSHTANLREGVPFYRFKRRTAEDRYRNPIDLVQELDGIFMISNDLGNNDAKTHSDTHQSQTRTRIDLSVVQILPLLITHGPKNPSTSQHLMQQFHLAVIILHELAVSSRIG